MAASNTGRKAPASSPPPATTNSSSSGTVKLKKATAKVVEPADSSVVANSQHDDSTSKVPASPSSTSGDTILCKHCKKQIPKDLHPSHSKPCLRAKQEQKRKKKEAAEKASKDAESGDVAKVEADKPDATPSKPIAPVTETPDEPPSNSKNSKKASVPEVAVSTTKKPTKKRKATDVDTASVNGDAQAAPKPPNKKQKKKDTSSAAVASATTDGTPTTAAGTSAAPTAGTPTTAQASSSTAAAAASSSGTATAATAKPKPGGKPKGPVDVEKQCGVLLPNGAMCARSLTCKSHAMGAKRAVPGRSLPYDVLLQQYQKKNQAKLHKAALASGAPLPEDGLDGQTGPVDSDEERDAVMAGILRAAPRPLAERAVVSVRQRTQAVRMREMLSQALAGNRGGGLFAVGPRRVPGGSAVEGGEGWTAQDGEGSRATVQPGAPGVTVS